MKFLMFCLIVALLVLVSMAKDSRDPIDKYVSYGFAVACFVVIMFIVYMEKSL